MNEFLIALFEADIRHGVQMINGLRLACQSIRDIAGDWGDENVDTIFRKVQAFRFNLQVALAQGEFGNLIDWFIWSAQGLGYPIASLQLATRRRSFLFPWWESLGEMMAGAALRT